MKVKGLRAATFSFLILRFLFLINEKASAKNGGSFIMMRFFIRRST